ncbi:TonB-linked SusC/RagA family outer membrane protein [Algoriphagus iocasae]|uniref:TonB-linked SusC/RagA family outer membrane protein n=1 Tax=Algoriphagus iocasae TaxID=1836499 RepID=A0A841MYZ1_9BACT|nr:TonB-dependent receptor [Algoriphagus iocasae]MBB6327858.1 TonB-linked SusC/RagA family outer membrane protein [Algoriphagus iocasae]
MKNVIIYHLLDMSKKLAYAFLLQIFSMSFLLANNTEAQTKSIDKVYIELKNSSSEILKVLEEIEKQTDFKFVYSFEEINQVELINIPKNGSVYDILLGIAKESSLNFKQINENIIVKNAPRQAKNLIEISIEQSKFQLLQGLVKDEQGLVLPGVTVLIEGTTRGTVTDENGEFQIEVEPGEKVVFSFVGFQSQTIAIENQTSIEVILAEDSKSLDEIVVIGYGTVNKSDLTGSVAQVKSEELNAFPTSNVMQALNGRAAGVQVIQNNGSPGAPTSIRIRGTNSIQGGNDPLYVVDGFPYSGNPTQLNNNDIESIEVLKDASATAIYGSRGANGVVLITTKQGTEGKTRVDLETSFSSQKLRKKLDLLNGTEYARLQNMQAGNDNIPLYFTEQEINSFGEGYDWQDLIFQNAPIYSSSLTVSGGNNKTKFSLSGGYFGQEGIVKGSDYDRYTLRANISHEINEKFSLIFNSNLSSLKTERRDSGGGQRGNSMIGAAISASPISQPYDEDGNYTVLGNEFPFVAPDIINPLNYINEQSNVVKANIVLSNLTFEYKPIPEISIKATGGIENRDDRTDSYTTRNFFNSDGSASVSTSQFRSLLGEANVTYQKTFSSIHKLTVLAGFTYQDFQTTFLSGSGIGFLSDSFETYSLGAAQTPGIPSSGYSNSVLLSYLGRLNYSLKDKYLFTFSFRTDGSSRYSENNKWGYFPSGAFAWKISEEEFLQNNPTISDLKLRTSYGFTGSQAISPYATLNQLSPGNTIFNNDLYTTFAPSSVLPGDLKWETTEQFDIGVDVGILDDRFTFSADYYVKNTKDLLNTVRLPSSLGFTTTIQNVGKVQNKGIEFGLNANVINNSSFKWSLFGNISFNENKVISLNNGEDILGAFTNVLVVGDNITILREGRPIGQFWGFVEDGYDETGRIKFKDLNEDGSINNSDKTYIGDPNPTFIYGLNSNMQFKGFELNIFIQGSQGNDIFNVSSIPSTLDYGQGMNMPKEVLNDHWSPDNTDAKYPIISRNVSARMSDRFVEDGSYLRFKNIQLAYNFPSQKMGMRNFQIYISAQNYITLTKYSWWDPEVNSRGTGTQQGIDHYSYPIPKTITAGLRLGF